jgi:hypothetical protein
MFGGTNTLALLRGASIKSFKILTPCVHPEVGVEVFEDDDAILAHALGYFDEIRQVFTDDAQLVLYPVGHQDF